MSSKKKSAMVQTIEGPYSNILDATKEGPSKTVWRREDQFSKAEEDVYIIFRFNIESRQVFRNAYVKVQKIIDNYRGRFIGFTDDVKVVENLNWPQNQCMTVLRFRTLVEAKRWLNSDPIFKQQDFEYEAFAVPVQYVPTAEYKTFALYEIRIPSQEDYLKSFEDDYVKPAASMMDEMHIAHGVVATTKSHMFRFSDWDMNGKTIVIHQFYSPKDFEAFYESEKYQALKQVRSKLCHVQLVTFTLRNDPPIGKH